MNLTGNYDQKTFSKKMKELHSIESKFAFWVDYLKNFCKENDCIKHGLWLETKEYRLYIRISQPSDLIEKVSIDCYDIPVKDNEWFFTFVSFLHNTLPKDTEIEFYNVTDYEKLGYFEMNNFEKIRGDKNPISPDFAFNMIRSNEVCCAVID